MKTPVTQSTQRAAQKLLAGLVPAHLAPDKPFGYITNRIDPENPFAGAPPRISFAAESVQFVKDVLAAMAILGYQTGFAVLVSGRSFEVVQTTPVQS